MKSHHYVRGAGRLRALMMTTAVAFIATFDPPAFGQACIPVVNGNVVVDGVVAGTNAGVMSMSGCAADPGWGGVVAQDFTPVGNMGLYV